MSGKNASLTRLDEKMQGLDHDSLRYHVLDDAKQFKTSWISLGRSLYTVWKDKAYKGWGYSTFETYTAKEIGIRKETALKLLRSYYFLEKEEPSLVRQDNASEPPRVAAMPSYEAVNVLRLAKNKKEVDADSYQELRSSVLEEGKDAKEVKKELTTLIRDRREVSPEDAYKDRREAFVRRLIGTLKTLKEEASSNKLLPMPLINETAALINKLQAELVKG